MNRPTQSTYREDTPMSQETTVIETPAAETPNTPAAEPRLPRPAPRKKRWGDRKDGRRVRTVYAMNKFMPFIMPAPA